MVLPRRDAQTCWDSEVTVTSGPVRCVLLLGSLSDVIVFRDQAGGSHYATGDHTR